MDFLDDQLGSMLSSPDPLDEAIAAHLGEELDGSGDPDPHPGEMAVPAAGAASNQPLQVSHEVAEGLAQGGSTAPSPFYEIFHDVLQ